MVTLREVTTLPDMPLWIRGLLILTGSAVIAVVAMVALPLSGISLWAAFGLLVVAAIGIDLVVAGIQKRWPWLMDLVLIAL